MAVLPFVPTSVEQMRNPDSLVFGRVTVSPRDSRGRRGEQRYWVAKRGREYIGAKWATAAGAEAWGLNLAQQAAGLAPATVSGVDSLTDLLEAWWEVTEDDPTKSPKTITSYRYSLRHIRDAGGSEPVATFDDDAVKRIVRELKRQGYAMSSIAQDLRVLSVAWTWARRCRPPLVHHDYPRVSLPKSAPVNTRHTPTGADVEAAIAHSSGNCRTALLIMYATGARQGEVCGLTWDRVDYARRQLTVTGKTGERTIEVGDALLDHLRHVQRTGRVRPVSAGTVGSQILAACGRAGVVPFRPHGVRRHVVDQLYATTDPGTAARILGHSAEVALAHYRRAQESDTRAALESAGLADFEPADVLPFPGRGNNGGTGGR